MKLRINSEVRHHSDLALADNQHVAPDPALLVLLGALVVSDEVVDESGLLLEDGVHPGCWHDTPDDTLDLVTLVILQVSQQRFKDPGIRSSLSVRPARVVEPFWSILVDEIFNTVSLLGDT